MRALIALALLFSGCGSDDKFTTPLGVHVSGSTAYSGADIDAAFTAATVDTIDVRADDAWHTITSSLSFSLDDMKAFGLPSIEFTTDKVACVTAGPDEDQGLGCYLFGSKKIVVQIHNPIGMARCIASETDLSHFVAHYAQQVYGYPVDHGAPIWPDVGESLEIKTQRNFYQNTCD